MCEKQDFHIIWSEKQQPSCLQVWCWHKFKHICLSVIYPLIIPSFSGRLSRSWSQRQQDWLISHSSSQQLPLTPHDPGFSGLFWKVCPSRMSQVSLSAARHAWNTFKVRHPGVHLSLSLWRSNSSWPLNLCQVNPQSLADGQNPDLALRSEWRSALLWLSYLRLTSPIIL